MLLFIYQEQLLVPGVELDLHSVLLNVPEEEQVLADVLLRLVFLAWERQLGDQGVAGALDD